MSGKKIIDLTKISKSLSKKTKNQQSSTTTPFKIDIQISALQSIQNNSKPTKDSSTPKQLLQNNKNLIQKFNTVCSQYSQSRNSSINHFHTINDRSIENQCKQEKKNHIKQIKLKYNENAQRCSEIGQKKLQRQNILLIQKMNRIEEELKRLKLEYESKLNIQSEYQNVKKQLGKYKNDRKNILSEYSKIKQQLKLKSQQNQQLKLRLGVKQIQNNGKYPQQQTKFNDVQQLQKLKLQHKNIQQKYQKSLLQFKKLQSKLLTKQQNILANKKCQQKLKKQIISLQSNKHTLQQLINTLNAKIQSQIHQKNLLIAKINESKDVQLINIYKNKIQIYQKNQYYLRTNRQSQIKKLVQENSRLKNQLIKLKQNPHLIETYGPKKQDYIQKINQLQRIIQNLRYENERIKEDNQFSILKMQNKIQQMRQQYEYIKKTRVEVKEDINNFDFDLNLKQMLTQNQNLKSNLKNINQQFYNLNNQYQQITHKYQSFKRDSQIQKLKAITQDRNKKTNHQIIIQNLNHQLQSYKRKIQMLSKKIDMKIGQIKKKDQFIQNVIMGKQNNSNQNQIQKLRLQIMNYFSANYQQKLFQANLKIQQLEKCIKKV